MLYILLITLLILLVISYNISGKKIVSPAFIFVSSFIFCVSWAVAFAKNWDLILHNNTYFVIAGGAFLFTIFAGVMHFIIQHFLRRPKSESKSGVQPISIEKWKLVLFILFELLSIYYTARELKRVTGAFSLSAAILDYRNSTILIDTQYSFPILMVLFRLITNAAGYWFVFVFSSNFISLHKVDICSLVIILLSCVSNALLGGRGNAINVLIALVVVFYILYNQERQLKSNLNFKIVIPGIVIAILVLILFQNFGMVLGRNSDTSSIEYLAKYCGAEIKNLDFFLQNKNFPIKTNYWGSQTFINVIKGIGPHIGMNTNYTLDLPFQQINGFNLGNVYTTFYPYIYDFGYKGVALLTPLMAIISQIFYEQAIYKHNNRFPYLSLIIYGYVFSSLLLSFFSNKFYEQNFSSTFLMNIIVWLLFTLFFCKITIFAKKK